MNTWQESLSEKERRLLVEKEPPAWVEPMLATLTDDRFSDPDWIFERKLDGERCLTFGDGEALRLMSRNEKQLNVHYPDLEAALATLEPEQFILDGEIVAFEGDVTSFSRLQQRMHIQNQEEAQQSDVKVYYYLFDLIYLDGYDTSQLPLRVRKSLLKRVFAYADPLRYMAHRNEVGASYFDEACERGWEGIIAKDGTQGYVNGRSRKWLKFKCVNQQELVIGGYTDPHGERIGFGALLLGYYAANELQYAGKVGTGFDDDTLRRLHQRLQALERETPPFATEDLPTSEVHWVAPRLVAEIGFEEWTEDKKLRQPRFLGLRSDKDARQVVKEEPA